MTEDGIVALGAALFLPAWVGTLGFMIARVVLRARRNRVLRERHFAMWKGLDEGRWADGYFRRNEHLRLGDPVLERAAERARIAGGGFLSFWLGGWLVLLVAAALSGF
jgi:hypothetical protein